MPSEDATTGPRRVALATTVVLAGALASGLARSQEAPAPPATQAPDLDALVPAPPLVRQHWTADNGLPVDDVNDVTQTPDGYLWIATWDGLVRFDGVRFTTFRSGEHAGLKSNRLLRLEVGADGALWVIDEQQNLIRYHRGAFVHVDRLAGRGGVKVYGSETGPAGEVWFATSRGLARAAVGDAGEPLVLLPLDRRRHEEPYDVLAVERDAHGALWVGTRHSGLLRLDHGGAVTHHAPWPVVWMFWWEEGTFFAQAGQRHRVAEVGPPADLARDRSGSAGVLHSVWVRDAAGGRWSARGTSLRHNGREVFRTPSTIRALLRDHGGNLWVGTTQDGLYRLRPSALRTLGAPEGLADDAAAAVVQTRSGAVWVGTGGGLSRIAGGRITTYPLPFRQVGALVEDGAGALWVGGSGLCVIEQPERGGACRIVAGDVAPGVPPGARPLGPHGINAMHEDASGAVWAGAFDGLYRLPRACRALACGSHFGVAGAAGMSRAFHERADGALWIGTAGAGLVRHAAGRFDTLATDDGLPSDNVTALYEDARGVLWIGTEDVGLIRLDPRGTDDLRAMPVRTYGTAEGLFADGIHQILPDGAGRLWMSTNRGLFWVTHAELEALHRGEIARVRSRSYHEADGLRNRAFPGGTQPAGMRDHRGRLWFASREGVAIVLPSELDPDRMPPPVLIEGVVAGGTRYGAGPGPAGVRLGAHERSFEVVYTAPVFVDPDGVLFWYRLEGYDRDWVEAGDRRTAYYTGVPPGAYTFRVRAQNSDGVWSEGTAAVAITVAPFFYETWWFRALCGLLLLALAAGAVRARTRRIEAQRRHLQRTVAEQTRSIQDQNERLVRQAEQLREMDALKTRFFTNVSHEFRTPLTLTIGPLEDLQQDLQRKGAALGPIARHNVDLALRNSRRLLRLINQLLDVAKLEAGEMKLDARVQDLTPFVRGIARSFVPLAERRRIRFGVEAPETPVPISFDAEKLEQVFVNLLSNAFKFTPEGGAVGIRLALEQDADARGAAIVAFRDSGPGIAPEALPHLFERFYQVEETRSDVQPGTGIGLSLAKDLTELHGGRLEVESEVGFGSTIIVRLPLDAPLADAGRAALAPDGSRPPAPSRSLGPNGHVAVAGVADDLPPEVSPPHAPPASEEDDRTTVLIADDNAEIRAYVRGHLEPHYRVLEAADGAAALEVARAALPDLVVSDVMMPQLDGLALLRALRADPQTDFLPVLLLTAKAADEDRIGGIEEGADDYLTKPFNVRELQVRIEALIASRRRLRARFAAPPPGGPAPPGALTAAGGLTAAGAAFLARVQAAIEAGLSDEEFGVEGLADAVGQSRSTLHRRLRRLVGEGPADYLRRARLDRAAILLGEGAGTVSEIAYAVGFRSVSHFTSVFRARFGIVPSAYPAAEPAAPTRGAAAR